jgi:predicted dehydrogenase
MKKFKVGIIGYGWAAEAHLPAINLILRENERQGTRDWLLTKTGVDPLVKYRCPWIEGYCSRTSLRAGETLQAV